MRNPWIKQLLFQRLSFTYKIHRSILEVVSNPTKKISKQKLDRFCRLFTGYTKAYGRYQVTEQESTGKNVGPRDTKVAPLLPEHYLSHLEGNGPGLGVIMLQETNTVRFGAADVDNYRLDLVALERRVRALQLPLVVCRTKSGGAHLYLFLSEPVSAELVRTKLAEWVSALNLSNRTEIFPKQSTRANASDIGSWINLPYQNAYGPTMRYALHEGVVLELEEFLEVAEHLSLSSQQISQATPGPYDANENEDPLFEAPPCLVTIHQQGGFPEGTRNDGMMAVGVYLKKRYGDNWEAHFQKYHNLFCKTPLDASELNELANSLRKKEYFYRCKQSPIAAVCQQRACIRKQFGVNSGTDDQPVQMEALAVNGLTQYSYPGENEESLWALELFNVRLMVSTETLLNPLAMASKLVEQGRVLPAGLSVLSKPKWHRYLEPILAKTECLDMSVRTGGPSPLWEMIREILRTVRRARNIEAFIEDPDMYAFQDSNMLYFTFSMLRKFLSYRQKKGISDMMLAKTLEGYGAKKALLKNVYVWQLENVFILSAVSAMPDKEAF